MHFDSELPIFSVVRSPWISDNPVFHLVISDSPTDDRNNVVDVRVTRVWQDTAGLVLQILIGWNATCYWSILEYFLFHVVCTCHFSVVLSLHNFRVLSLETVFVAGTWRAHAILTLVFTSACSIRRICSQLCLTRVVRYTFFECEFVNIHRLPSVATVAWAQTIHDHLRWQCPVL